ncbi:hypothetical protein NHF50_03390 [Flavobacterium sp. NRK F10]|uniref:hypothetical protein n=1 Tax=Flavobacterium sp. NRK F10 TaxID=2954931 RepID=UPI002091CF4F|nr:hypothetical protein [Flavobacterium sp. NRK F10]MCO6174080.1 hypothetical protein [Flavobacterium sp. NRK F10]
MNDLECSYQGTTCEMGKFIADLNFSSVQCVKEMKLELEEHLYMVYSQKQSQFFYTLSLPTPVQNFIWRPPKKLL